MQKLQVMGVLPVGVLVNGKLCNVVTLREATLRDGLKADIVPDNADAYYPKLAIIASCLTIDGVPPEQITHDFIMDLDLEDGEYLLNLKAELTAKKKEQVQAAALLTP